MALDEPEDVTFKVILLGDTAVGKSCITTQYVEGRFLSTTKTTIGCDYAVKRLNLSGRVVKLELWDTVRHRQAGQETYRAITRSFYKLANAAVLVYAITRKHSLESVDAWLTELRSQTEPNLPVFLAGNMLDLETIREVSFEDGRQFSASHKMNGFEEVSAKSDTGLEDLFLHVAELLLKRQQEATAMIAMNQSHMSIPSILSQGSHSENHKKGCC